MDLIRQTQELATEATAGAKAEAVEIAAAAGGYLVQTEDQASIAIATVRDIKAKRKALEAKRASILGPMSQAVDEIKALFNPAIKALEQAEKDLKGEVVQWGEDRISDADTLLEAVGRGELGEIETKAALVEARELTTFEIPGYHVQARWTGEVTDAEALPREYLVPDEVALRKLTQKAKQDPGIPGWRGFAKRTGVVK